MRFNPFFVGGDFLQNRLGGLVVIPKIALGRFLLEFGDLFYPLFEVKDTSLTWPAFRLARPGNFLHQLRSLFLSSCFYEQRANI